MIPIPFFDNTNSSPQTSFTPTINNTPSPKQVNIPLEPTFKSPIESPSKRIKPNEPENLSSSQKNTNLTENDKKIIRLSNTILEQIKLKKLPVTINQDNPTFLKIGLIPTTIPVFTFCDIYAKILLGNPGDNTIFPDRTFLSNEEEIKKIQIIFLNTTSKKTHKSKIKLFFVPPKTIAKGSCTEYKNIHQMGTNKIKGFKKSLNVKNHFYIDREQTSLQALHSVLPIDKILDRKGSKHLGIHDNFKFGQFDVLRQHSYCVGTAFEGNITNLNLRGPKILKVLYQIAFALKIFDDYGLFTHNIKPSKVLFKKDENFPLEFRVVLSGVNLETIDDLRKFCEEKDLNNVNPFGTSTPMYQPDTDHEKMLKFYDVIKKIPRKDLFEEDNSFEDNDLFTEENNLIKEENNRRIEKKFENIFKKTLKLRRKNMISLLGQTFFQILTGHSKEQDWTTEFTEERTRKFKKNALIIIRNYQFEETIKQNVRLTKEERLFCNNLKDLILTMTDLNYRNRPTAGEVLNYLLDMIKEFSRADYNIIVKNGWTNGYADWE